MTIDEAIEHAESKAACTPGACGQEHADLARWLRELRMRRENEDSCGQPTHWLLLPKAPAMEGK